MPAIFDLLYREYCRACLAEMRKQLLISRAESRRKPMNTCPILDLSKASPCSRIRRSRHDTGDARGLAVTG